MRSISGCRSGIAALAVGITCAFLPAFARATEGVLYVSPERGNYRVGERFDMRVLIDTDNSVINAAEAELRFDPRDLTVEQISTDGSILGTWPTEPRYSNADGTIAFSGWTREPYNGADGLLVTVTFRALRTVSSGARFAAGAALAAGSSEANIITSMRSAAVSIAPEVVTPALETSVVPSAPSQPAEVSDVPLQPMIMAYERTIDEGGRIEVVGAATPGVRIEATLELPDGVTQRAELAAQDDGSFTFVVDHASDGLYRIWFAEVSADGVRSEPSRVVAVEVHASRSENAQAAAGVSTDALPYLVSVAIAAIVAAFIVHRYRETHH